MTPEQIKDCFYKLYGRQNHTVYASRIGMTFQALHWALKTGHLSKKYLFRLHAMMGERFLLGDEKTRPVLIGRNDYMGQRHRPYWPDRGMGYDLWSKLNSRLLMSKAEYLRVFDRRVLTWLDPGRIKFERQYVAEAYQDGPRVRASLAGRKVILMDDSIARILELQNTKIFNGKYLHWYEEDDGMVWCRTPRRPPMGLWKEKENNEGVTNLLVDVYLDWLSLPY